MLPSSRAAISAALAAASGLGSMAATGRRRIVEGGPGSAAATLASSFSLACSAFISLAASLLPFRQPQPGRRDGGVERGLVPRLGLAGAARNVLGAVEEGSLQLSIGPAGQVLRLLDSAARIAMHEQASLRSAAALAQRRSCSRCSAADGEADGKIVAVAQAHADRAVGAVGARSPSSSRVDTADRQAPNGLRAEAPNCGAGDPQTRGCGRPFGHPSARPTAPAAGVMAPSLGRDAEEARRERHGTAHRWRPGDHAVARRPIVGRRQLLQQCRACVPHGMRDDSRREGGADQIGGDTYSERKTRPTR